MSTASFFFSSFVPLFVSFVHLLSSDHFLSIICSSVVLYLWFVFLFWFFILFHVWNKRAFELDSLFSLVVFIYFILFISSFDYFVSCYLPFFPRHLLSSLITSLCPLLHSEGLPLAPLPQMFVQPLVSCSPLMNAGISYHVACNTGAAMRVCPAVVVETEVVMCFVSSEIWRVTDDVEARCYYYFYRYWK